MAESVKREDAVRKVTREAGRETAAVHDVAQETPGVASLSFPSPGPAIEAWLETNRSWANGMAEVGQEWASLAQSQARRMLDAGARVGGCRGIDEVIAIQGEVLGDSTRACLDRMQRISELSTRLVWNGRPRV